MPVVTILAPKRTGEPSITEKRWSCAGGEIVAGGNQSSGFELTATCEHGLHREMGQYPSLAVSDVEIISPDGRAITGIPADATGCRLRFSLGPHSFEFAPTIRVEIFPDPEGPQIAMVEDINAGTYSDPATIEVKLKGKANRERQLSIHVLDPDTARRDWGADAVKLWQGCVPVQ